MVGYLDNREIYNTFHKGYSNIQGKVHDIHVVLSAALEFSKGAAPVAQPPPMKLAQSSNVQSSLGLQARLQYGAGSILLLVCGFLLPRIWIASEGRLIQELFELEDHIAEMQEAAAEMEAQLPQ